MKKSLISSLLIASLIFLPFIAMADLGDVVAKSKDIEITMFGRLKTLPHIIENADFNSDNTRFDQIGEENGNMEDHSIRNEIRFGWAAKASDWDFLIVLEHDFTLNKVNVDRQTGASSNKDTFGVEKLDFGYNFTPAIRLSTGWSDKFLDINSGGILYGDDHPFIGFNGKFGNHAWEALYIIIQDEIEQQGSGALDGDTLDWRVYTLRAGFNLSGFTLAPIYAFSDNEAALADVHYLGFEGFGKLGIFTPRFEFIYAMGDKKVLGADDKDIKAFGGFASIEASISKALNIYAGGYYLSGDDDAADDDVEAFNGITNISRYTPTFGMENALIYRTVSAMGSVLYSNNFALLGTPGSGYGGIGNSSRGENSPGMISLGVGARGDINEQFSYKTQIQYFMFAEEDGLTNVVNPGQKVDDTVGIEFDLNLTYKFNSHFSLGNTLSVFFPDDGITDRLGRDFDETAILNTIEMVWQF